MPILIYNTSQGSFGGVLNGRTLIGREQAYGISFEDKSVSRLHAWIDAVADENAEYVITDAGSKAGTFINDQRVTRQPLHHGDVIRVGKFTVQYQDQETLPDEVSTVDLIAPPPVVRGSGILFECGNCGAPIWVGDELAGKRGICRHCRKPVTVPSAVEEESTSAAVDETPAAVPAVEPVETESEAEIEPPVQVKLAQPSPATVVATARQKSKCAVCHSSILPGEEMTSCPDCAMNFHAECWQENYGCSSYGCPQVNCLQPQAESTGERDVAVETEEEAAPKQGSWELVLLAASIIGAVVGSILFGGLSLLIGVTCLVVLLRKKPARTAMLVVAFLICLLGMIAGLGVSDFYWFDARHIPPVIIQHIHF